MTATSLETATVPTAEAFSTRSRVAAVLRKWPIVQLVALVVVFVVGASTLDGFVSQRAITNMLVTASFLGIAAAGQTLVILVGGVDMSIGAVISAAAIMTSFLYGVAGWPFGMVGVAILIGTALVGAVNGFLSERFGANPLIITLGMGFVVIGLAQAFTGGASQGLSTPEWLGLLSRPVSTTFGLAVPPVVAIWIVLILIVLFVTLRTPSGKRLYAAGASPLAAEFALVRLRWVWVAVFAASAAFAAVAGILLAGFAGSGNTTLGDPYLFLGLAAVIVGGTTMSGRGGYLQTCIAALLLTAIQTLLIGYGFSNADRQIAFGVLILVAVAGYVRSPRLRNQL